MSQKWNIIGFVLLACTLSGCSSHSNTSVGSANTSVHAQAMAHLASGLGRLMRGVGQGPNVQRATQGDLEQAVVEFREAIRLEPDNHQASFGLTEALIKLNKKDEATTILQSLAKNNDDYGRIAQKTLTKMGVTSTK